MLRLEDLEDFVNKISIHLAAVRNDLVYLGWDLNVINLIRNKL